MVHWWPHDLVSFILRSPAAGHFEPGSLVLASASLNLPRTGSPLVVKEWFMPTHERLNELARKTEPRS
ncbi:hypothetical protein B9Z32_02130 [Limnohabitans sp. MMS-10A-178]|nr:hypothetical protein B9Z32_02130 [Limnohabitans sp. MMS-10A-178]